MDKINLSIINKYEDKCSQVYKELEIGTAKPTKEELSIKCIS